MREVQTLAVDSSIDTSRIYRIVNAQNPSLCMEVAKASKTEGANVRLFTINNSEAQMWEIDVRSTNSNGKTYYIAYNYAGKALTINHKTKNGQNYLSPGFNAVVRFIDTKKYPYSGWQFTKSGRTTTFQGQMYDNYYIHIPTNATLSNGKNWVLDCYGGTPTSGTNIDIAHVDSKSSLTDQEWILVPMPIIRDRGIYEIYSYRDPKMLWDVNGLTKVNGASLKLHTPNDGNNQKFEIRQYHYEDADYVTIKSIYSDKFITAFTYPDIAAGDDIVQWELINDSSPTGIYNGQEWSMDEIGSYSGKIHGLSNLPVVEFIMTASGSPNLCIDDKNASNKVSSNLQLNTITHDASEKWILVPTTAIINDGELPTDLSAWNWHWDSLDYETIDTEEDAPVELLEPNINTPKELYFYGYNDNTLGLNDMERYWRLNPRIMPSYVLPMSWYLLGGNRAQGATRFRYLDALTNTWSSWTEWTPWKTIQANYLQQLDIEDSNYIPGEPYTAFVMGPQELKMFVYGSVPAVQGLNKDMYTSLPLAGGNETFAIDHYGVSTLSELESLIHIAKRYQWQYKLRTVVSDSSWTGSLQGPTVTLESPYVNVIFKPKWEIVNDPTSTEPWESWIPYFYYDGLHIPYETDYDYGTNKFHLNEYSCIQTTDEAKSRKLNSSFVATNDADALEFVIPLQYIFWPDEDTDVSLTYNIGTDFWTTYPGTEQYTISSIVHRDGETLDATPISVTENDGATLKVRVPHIDKERAFVVYFQDGSPVIKEITNKSVYSIYTDFIVEYQFNADLEIWVMVYDKMTLQWGYDCSTVLDKSDSRIHSPCHAFNWDGGSFILECRKDDYLETGYSMSKNSETYKLNNRKYETVIFGTGYSSKINNVEGFVAKDLTENDFKDIQALLNQGHVRYRSPDGTVHNVAVVSASWNTKYYGDYDGNNIMGSEVKLELIEETI